MSEVNNDAQSKAKLSFIKGKKVHEYIFDLTNPADIRKYNQALKLDDDKRNTYLLLLSREQLKDKNPNSTYIHQMKLIEEQPNPALSELKRSEKKSVLEKKKERLNYLTNKVDLTEEEEEEFKRLPKEIEKLESDIQELKSESDISESSSSKITNPKTLLSTVNAINKSVGKKILTKDDVVKILSSNAIIPALTEAVRRANKIHKIETRHLSKEEKIIAEYGDHLKTDEKLTGMFLSKSKVQFRDKEDWITCFNLFQLLPNDFKYKVLQKMDWSSSNLTDFKEQFIEIISDVNSFKVFISALNKINELTWFANELRENYEIFNTKNEDINKFISVKGVNAYKPIQDILTRFLEKDIIVKYPAKKSSGAPSIKLRVTESGGEWYCGLISKGAISKEYKTKFNKLIEKTKTAFDGDFDLDVKKGKDSGVPLISDDIKNTVFVHGTQQNITQIFIMLLHWDNGKIEFNTTIKPELIYETPFDRQILPVSKIPKAVDVPVVDVKEEPKLEEKVEETIDDIEMLLEEKVEEPKIEKKEMKEIKEDDSEDEVKEMKEKKKKKEKRPKKIKESSEDVDFDDFEYEEETEKEDEPMMGKGISENDYQHIKTELQTIKSLLFTVIYKMNKKDRDKYNKKNNKSGSFNWLFN